MLHYLGILAPSDRIPTNARFHPEFDSKVLVPMLKLRKEIGSPLMVNLNYAIFHPNAIIYNPVTKLKYISMFDVQMGAVYTAMRKCSAMVTSRSPSARQSAHAGRAQLGRCRAR
jgi:hypothetical protein